jgi:hypothetical protein
VLSVLAVATFSISLHEYSRRLNIKSVENPDPVTVIFHLITKHKYIQAGTVIAVVPPTTIRCTSSVEKLALE